MNDDSFQTQNVNCFTNTMKFEQETNKPHNQIYNKKNRQCMHMQIFKNILGVPIFMGFTPFQHSKLTHPKLWLKYTKLEPPKSQ